MSPVLSVLRIVILSKVVISNVIISIVVVSPCERLHRGNHPIEQQMLE
jgi:hypothetical protein